MHSVLAQLASPPVLDVASVACLAAALWLFRSAVTERRGRAAALVLPAGIAVAALSLPHPVTALAAAIALSSVVCAAAAVALRFVLPRPLADLSALEPLADGSPGWWPRFERDFRWFAQRCEIRRSRQYGEAVRQRRGAV
jgi:hypothetical protein